MRKPHPRVIELSRELILIRERSHLQNVRDFSEEVGLSDPALLRHETATCVPERETLERILDVGRVPPREADRIRHLRDVAYAAREGLNLFERIPKEEIEGLSGAVFEAVQTYLLDCTPSIEFPKREASELKLVIEKAMREVLDV